MTVGSGVERVVSSVAVTVGIGVESVVYSEAAELIPCRSSSSGVCSTSV